MKNNIVLTFFICLCLFSVLNAQGAVNKSFLDKSILIEDFYDYPARKGMLINKLKTALEKEGFTNVGDREKADVILKIDSEIWIVLHGTGDDDAPDKHFFSLTTRSGNLFWKEKVSVLKKELEKETSYITKHFIEKIREIDLDNKIKLMESYELTLEDGVKPHKGIDAVYKTFSEGYRTSNPELVANIYTEDAAYLSPNDSITNGRKAILENFTSFFNNVKGRDQNMTISFQIFQRKVTKKMGYDVGIYTITFYKDGKEVGNSKGKFVVVALRGKDKKWRFQVDGYSNIK